MIQTQVLSPFKHVCLILFVVLEKLEPCCCTLKLKFIDGVTKNDLAMSMINAVSTSLKTLPINLEQLTTHITVLEVQLQRIEGGVQNEGFDRIDSRLDRVIHEGGCLIAVFYSI